MTSRATAPGLDFSVLLPLQEDRAVGEQCVRAWTRGQTLERDRYEVIVLSCGLDPELEASVRPLLGPNDTFVTHGERNEYDLFNLGAGRARGRWLFLTEAHCVPEPECLQAMVDHLETTGGPGARGRSIGRALGAMGRLEQEVYEDYLRTGENDDHWRKVLIHCLAISRAVFAEVGGFDPRYGDFAGWRLAIALREHGHRLGYTARSAVVHHYTGELRILANHVRDFGRGQMRFCAETPPAKRSPYLPEAEEWTDRWSSTAEGAQRALRAAAAGRRARASLAWAIGRHALVALAGPRAAVAMAAVAAGARGGMVRLTPWTGGRRQRAYLRFWDACARLGRREFLASPAAPPAPSVRTASVVEIGGAEPDARMLGFHAAEAWQGSPFRWSSPVALVEVTPPADARAGRFELLPVRSVREGSVSVVIDGVRVPSERCVVELDGVCFPVAGGAPRSIALVCGRWHDAANGAGDRRPLGLAVTRLSFALR